MKRVRKVIATLLIVASVITVNSIQANASTTGWQGSNSEGWWYVDNAGSYVTGWEYIDGQWYYFSEAGWMLSNITIDGYYLTSTGAWDSTNGNSSYGNKFNDKLRSNDGIKAGTNGKSAQSMSEQNGYQDNTQSNTSSSGSNGLQKSHKTGDYKAGSDNSNVNMH